MFVHTRTVRLSEAARTTTESWSYTVSTIETTRFAHRYTIKVLYLLWKSYTRCIKNDKKGNKEK